MLFNVIHTVNSLESRTGGPARSVTNLCLSLKKFDLGVSILSCRQNHVNDYLKRSAIAGYVSECSLPLGLNFEKKLTTLINSYANNHVIVHDHGLWLLNNHVTARTAKKLRIPLIVSPRGMLSPWARKYKNVKKTLAWLLYQRRNLKVVSVFHATSEQEAKIIQSLGFRIPVAIIPNGVHIPLSTFLLPQARKKKTVLFLGRIHPVKGLDIFVAAWAKLRPGDWTVVIAGPDEVDYRRMIEHEILRLGLVNSFDFIGPVSDEEKWNLYAGADLFILPSYTENFGIVVAEALACGTPVITTKGTPWAAMEEHRCGWWVDIGVEPLVKALKEAMDLAPEARHEMGQRGRRFVEKKYSWERIGHEMFSVYQWMLEGGVPPSCVILD